MTHIRKTVLATLLACSLGTYADDNVTIVTAKGTTTYSMDKMTRIDLGSDELKVVATDGTGTTYAFDNVQKIVISLAATSIDTPTANETPLTLTISADGSEMSFGGWDSAESVTLGVYDASGGERMRRDRWSGQTVDISSLPSGVYVAKAGSHTAKFRK